MPHDVIMPALGMAQDTGKIVSWLKAPGDKLDEGDVLFEVETDKAVMEVPASVGGFLSAVAAPVDAEVAVGGVIAKIVDSSDEVELEVEPLVLKGVLPITVTSAMCSNSVLEWC